MSRHIPLFYYIIQWILTLLLRHDPEYPGLIKEWNQHNAFDMQVCLHTTIHTTITITITTSPLHSCTRPWWPRRPDVPRSAIYQLTRGVSLSLMLQTSHAASTCPCTTGAELSWSEW